ncbi:MULTISPECIES: Crp/Fnr family transcriptional regulator [Paenibacillus]|jgi:CRP/FNR family transcriptional regulator|uniref:Crp/Fnr family transcriptional regulator n=1 Tax=Paenibacillus oceani TaxID=2772510 RepID=A0A927H014_9BACL|nr:Crp/Fnr family transcriptional regulator [Paenibacillus oceani]MBD2863566.1 Crp/Fnr family transcriptional regulator [Paenibacillus oceani]MDF2662997.1 transcriptional regulator, Crp/Fnr family [Paenibacillus sp.]
MEQVAALIRKIPLFQDLNEEELKSISALFFERKYKKNTILFLEEDEGEELFIVRSGTVKIYRIDNNKQITLALFRSGDFFGEMSIIEKGSTRSANAETLEPCVIYTLKRSTFYEYVDRNPGLCMRLLEITMNRLRRANEQIRNLTFLDVRTRVLKIVHQLSKEYGEPKAGGVIQISIKLTHQEIANMVGTVRESVTKVLQELQDDRIISIRNKMIRVESMEGLVNKIVD